MDEGSVDTVASQPYMELRGHNSQNVSRTARYVDIPGMEVCKSGAGA